MLSYWEKQSFTKFDYAIVGAGITGLSTALSLRENAPEATIIVLERGLRPSGASTRNAGFACFGSASELLDDLENMGQKEMLALVEERWTGLELLRKRVGDVLLGYENKGGYEVLGPKDMYYLDRLDQLNELLRPLFPDRVFSPANEKIKKFGFNPELAAGMIYNPFESQLNTGMMMRALWDMALEAGIHVVTGAEVISWAEHENGVELVVTGALQSDRINLRAGKVGVCTNGFTRKLFPEVPLYPGRGLVLVTTPVADLKFHGAFHMDQGFYYFRDLGDRVLFGGGRNLDMEEETTTEFGENPVIREKLEYYLKELILPGTSFNIDHSWSGIMAFGRNKVPILKEHKPRIFLGVRLGGMGVAIGTQVGQKLAEMMTGV